MAIKIQSKRGAKAVVAAATGYLAELFYDTTDSIFYVCSVDNSATKVPVNKAFTSAGVPSAGGIAGCLYVDTTNATVYYCSAPTTFTKVSLKLDDAATDASGTWSGQKIQQVITAASWGVGEFQDSVKDNDLATPPVTPTNGDRYIIAADPTGAWANKAGQIAQWNTALTPDAWEFKVPTEGICAYVDDEDLLFIYSGSAWVPINNYALASSEPGSIADASSGAVGSSSQVARQDHSHDLSIAANYITLAMMEHGTRGDLVAYNGSGGPPGFLAAGADGYVLTAGGAATDIGWEAIPAPAADSIALTQLAHGAEQGSILAYQGGTFIPTELLHGAAGQYLMSAGHGADVAWGDITVLDCGVLS
jgi:hypothetical protein